MRKDSLTRFDNGGSHQSNELGGIPIGIGSNGQMNTTQEGETKKEDFVFSNDIKLNKSVIKEFNLPSNLGGKTAASATKIIDNKFKDRNDKISLSTKNKMLDAIANAQESIKAKRQSISDSMEANSTEVPDLMNGQAPEGFEEFLPQNQMFLGGFTGGNSSTGNSMLQGAGMAGMTIGDGNFEDRYNYNPELKAQYQQMEGVKDGIAGAFGPYGQIFRGIEKGGKGLGTAIGGETGGDIASGILDPFSGQMETFKNKESTGWEKAAVVAAPFLSGVIGGLGRKRAESKAARGNHIANANLYTNDFALGGDTREPITAVTSNPLLENYNLNQNLASQYYFDNLTRPTTTNITNTPISTFNNSYPKANLKPAVNWLGQNYGNIMRYAPVATNALQLSKLEKPGTVRLNRLDNRFVPDYVDERSIQNIVGNELDNTINGLTNTTNGSLGSLRNSIIAAGLNKTKALSDAYLSASDRNRAQRLQAQDFNRNTDQFNIGQSNLELDINDRNSAAYETNKSRLISALGEDIGNIGKEEVYKDIARKTYGYTWNGRYWTKPDGTTATDAEVKAEVASNSNKNKLGGMLINNKKK